MKRDHANLSGRRSGGYLVRDETLESQRSSAARMNEMDSSILNDRLVHHRRCVKRLECTSGGGYSFLV